MRCSRDGCNYGVSMIRPGEWMAECHQHHVETLGARRKAKDKARALAKYAKRKGEIVAGPCEDCGSPRSQMHHNDYARPLDVRWLCRPCHLAHHQRADSSTSPLSEDREKIGVVVPVEIYGNSATVDESEV